MRPQGSICIVQFLDVVHHYCVAIVGDRSRGRIIFVFDPFEKNLLKNATFFFEMKLKVFGLD